MSDKGDVDDAATEEQEEMELLAWDEEAFLGAIARAADKAGGKAGGGLDTDRRRRFRRRHLRRA